MTNYSYSVRWSDLKGETHRKEYDDLSTARKAVKWVEEHGGRDPDIAIVLHEKKVETPVVDIDATHESKATED